MKGQCLIMEIERKFLIDKFPDNLPLKEESVMYQGYISVMPTVRIRKKISSKGSSYKLTIKSSGEMFRHEVEFDISEEKYNELQEVFCPNPIIKLKKNYILPDGKILECNLVDEGSNTEFMYAEIEFDSVGEAENYSLPHFLGKEVTFDNSYKMNNYWKRTRIENE